MANEAQSSGGIAGGGGGGGSVNSVNSGTDITVDNTDPANPIVNFSGTNNTPIEVANYSALPAPGTATGRTYIVLASQGTQWLPGSLGGTYYGKGYYYDNGVTYTYSEIPYNATQTEVNTGTNTDKFVTPATLAAATTVIPKTGTTGDIISFSATNTPTRIAAVATGYLFGSQGTSTLPAWLQAATLNISLTTPLLIGGTGTTSPLTFQTTTGVATTGADFIWKGGTNGATELMRLNNQGYLRVNNSIATASTQTLVAEFNRNSFGNNSNTSFISIGFNGRKSFQLATVESGSIFKIGYSNPTSATSFGSQVLQVDYLGNFTTQSSVQSSVINGTSSSYFGGASLAPTARVHIAAGTATASTAPLKLTTGTNLTTPEVGAVEYNNTFHVTNSDATRRHIATAPNTTKVTAGAPYTNDGYVVINIGGTDFKVMTTA
ncbi:MAG: hypothetical protein IT212_07545 [Bacteroidia bacterium]|nr:hypothetical protein [Bacteroidia bacterium]